MGKFIPLYIWMIITLLVGTVVYYLASLGLATMVYNLDITHITQIIAFIAIVSNLTIGFLAWKHATQPDAWHKKRVRKWLRGVWFYATQVFLWGILGTVCGSMFLFYSSFGGSANLASFTLATLAPHLLPPLGIVFSTTALGVASALFLSNQLFWFSALSGVDGGDE